MSYIVLAKIAYAVSIGHGIYHVLSSALCSMIKPIKQLLFFVYVDQVIVMHCANISSTFLSAMAQKSVLCYSSNSILPIYV